MTKQNHTRLLFVGLTLIAMLIFVSGSSAVPDSQPEKAISALTWLPQHWSGEFSFFAPGGVFRPRDSDVTWDYHAGGCISMATGNDWFTVQIVRIQPGTQSVIKECKRYLVAVAEGVEPVEMIFVAPKMDSPRIILPTPVGGIS